MLCSAIGIYEREVRGYRHSTIGQSDVLCGQIRSKLALFDDRYASNLRREPLFGTWRSCREQVNDVISCMQ
eukprot:SAG31_NODE_327_length_17650_cov_18.626574_14_plen_71_part_00